MGSYEDARDDGRYGHGGSSQDYALHASQQDYEAFQWGQRQRAADQKQRLENLFPSSPPPPPPPPSYSYSGGGSSSRASRSYSPPARVLTAAEIAAQEKAIQDIWTFIISVTALGGLGWAAWEIRDEFAAAACNVVGAAAVYKIGADFKWEKDSKEAASFLLGVIGAGISVYLVATNKLPEGTFVTKLWNNGRDIFMGAGAVAGSYVGVRDKILGRFDFGSVLKGVAAAAFIAGCPYLADHTIGAIKNLWPQSSKVVASAEPEKEAVSIRQEPPVPQEQTAQPLPAVPATAPSYPAYSSDCVAQCFVTRTALNNSADIAIVRIPSTAHLFPYMAKGKPSAIDVPLPVGTHPFTLAKHQLVEADGCNDDYCEVGAKIPGVGVVYGLVDRKQIKLLRPGKAGDIVGPALR